MDDFEKYATSLIGLMGLLAIAATFIYLFMRELTSLFAMVGHSLTPLATIDKDYLERTSPYYRSLSPAGRKTFSKRVKEFIFEKDWIGRGVEVTREMRLRIAGIAVQITMGLDRLLLLHFERIVIYPDQFKNPRTGAWHYGEVTPGTRSIVLSWRHFVEGEDDPDDARHLGLHEMAHALWLEDRIDNVESDFLDAASMKRWRALAQNEALRIQAGEKRLFRKYAGTDQAEFFAVAVEYFFEQPREFKEALPELYDTMQHLLGQDPTRPA